MSQSGASIEAILRLETTPFLDALTKTKQEVNNFRNSLLRVGRDSPQVEQGILRIQKAISLLIPYLQRFKNLSSESKAFNQFSSGLNKMSEAVMNFSNVSKTSQAGILRINSIIKEWSNAVRNLTVNIKGSTVAEQQEVNTLNQLKSAYSSTYASATNLKEHLASLKMEFASMDNSTAIGRQNLALYHQNLKNLALGVEQFNAIGNKASTTMNKMSTSSNVGSSNISKMSTSMARANTSANQLSASTSRLGKAMSSLRMMGGLVASMFAYNFAHKLLVATGETVHAKSEMEGYFKMLHFSQSQIDGFNKALDQTVSQFQRVNKYSLGETIASIGVEFNLTTEEMQKAMKVTSMITSEYLRAGRNANEASLAVKDVLQGQFQRLSRETGVKGEQLKEAGWSGDTTDVLGLMDALEKVAMSRNWDVFAEKANSLNDIITIVQNRFGEWSADMVNVVQPSIVNTFNALMSVGQGFANLFGGVWEWLNTDGWGQTAVKIGAVGTALLTTSQMLLMYRTNMGLVEASQLGLTQSIASVVLGLKGQELAEVGVRNSIMAKILGVKAETIANTGVTASIQEKLIAVRSESVQNQLSATYEKLKTMATEENTIAERINAVQADLNTASQKGLITAKQEETIQEELNTASKELNELATLKQTETNGGLIASLYLLGTEEALVTGETGALATAIGVLNGVISLSPIGWFIFAVTGLATAVYGLSGGFDSLWGSLQNATKAVEDASSATKPYRDYVDQTNRELEVAKEKYGENSLIVQTLSEKYDRAKDSLDRYYEKLQQATSQHGKLNEELGVTSAKMDEIMRTELGDVGYGEAEIDEMTTGISDLARLTDHDYVALQKHNAMMGNFSDNIHKFAENAGNDTEAIENFGRTYHDFITYSDKANTADNWWDREVNHFMAGMSSTSLEFQKLMKGVWDDEGLNKIENYKQRLGGLWQGINDALGGWQQGAMDFLKPLNDFGDEVNKFLEAPLDYLGISIPSDWNIWKLFGFDSVSASDGSSDHPSFMEDLSAIVGFDIQAWVDSFTSDPLGTLGIDLSGFDIIGTLSDLIFGNHDGSDDPNDISWINSLFPPLDPSSIMTYVQDNIVTPMGDALFNGITSIPIVSDILALFGLVNGENSGASQKGTDIGNAFKTKVEDIVRNIPILGDVLQFLGVIPQANGDAHDKGHGVGSNISDGTKAGMGNLGSFILQEFNDALAGIGRLGQEAYNTAQNWANQLWNGVNSVLQRASPGFFHDEIKAEFGTDIPTAIDESGSTAYTSAQAYAQNMYAGMNSVQNEGFGLGSVVGEYESDAQVIASSSEMMGMTTTTAFNEMGLAINTSTSQMANDVGIQYTSMQQKQNTMLQTMKTQNLNAYNEMYLKSNQSLIQMRDSTSNITAQMISAWNFMKTQLVATANSLRNESANHFNSLSATIGAFYRKIQNPSNWGAGVPTRSSKPRNPSVGRSFVKSVSGRHGAGVSPYQESRKMTIRDLMAMLNMSDSTPVDMNQFLASIIGMHGYGWSGWDTTHMNYIKTQSDAWSMVAPMIMGWIPANSHGYKVGDFENGSPQLGWSDFVETAESLFSHIPYSFYWDSAKYGSWQNALRHGEANCSDGADALIALASVFGFSGFKQHTYTRRDHLGHFYAVINGHKMDTTNFQNSRSWSPLGAGVPTRTARSSGGGYAPNRTVNVNIDMKDATIYGVDDLENRIEEATKRAMRDEFNDPYAVAL